MAGVYEFCIVAETGKPVGIKVKIDRTKYKAILKENHLEAKKATLATQNWDWEGVQH